MTPLLWIVVIVAASLLYLAVWGVISGYVGGLRGHDPFEAFKTGLFFGPIGAAVVIFRNDPVPDIEVDCPHCGMRQDVDATLTWFECWQCEKRATLPQRAV